MGFRSRYKAVRPRYKVVAGLVVAGVAALVVHEVNAPDYGVRAAPRADAPACGRLDYPDRLGGQRRKDVSTAGVGVWGDGAVVLRCGLTPPAPTVDACVDIDDVDWVWRDAGSRGGSKVLVTYGRDPAVEVEISSRVDAVDAVLVEMGRLVKPIAQKSKSLGDGDVLLGRVVAGANRHDSPLLAPTLDRLVDLGPLPDDITVHLDAGYDSDKTRARLHKCGLQGRIAHKGEKAPIQASQRWHVERTHAWQNAFHRLARCYRRRGGASAAQTAVRSFCPSRPNSSARSRTATLPPATFPSRPSGRTAWPTPVRSAAPASPDRLRRSPPAQPARSRPPAPAGSTAAPPPGHEWHQYAVGPAP